MKDTLTEGLSTVRGITIDRTRTIGFMGDDCRVYATPAMIADIEMSCRELIVDHLDDGQDSVGTRVEIDHLAPGLEGAEVEISVKVAKLDGRAVTFAVSVTDGTEELGRGLHNRFIVDIAKTKERLLAKAAKLAGD